MNSFMWWRSWHGAPMDHKWSVIAVRAGIKTGIVSAIGWALFDYASQQKDRGSVIGFDTEEYAVYSGFSEQEILLAIQAMTEKGVIVEGRLKNWEKRQPKREDDSNARVGKYRDLKRIVTQSNAEAESVTSDSLSLSLSVSESVKELSTINREEEGDAFDITQRMCEELTRCTAVPNDVKTINQFVEMGVIREDITGALAWLEDNQIIVKRISQLAGAVGVQVKKRVQSQATNGHRPPKFALDADGKQVKL